MNHDNLTLNELMEQKIKQSHKIIEIDKKMVKLVIFTLANDWYAFHGENITEILS